MALDKNKLKLEGLKFGRVLQSVFRLAAMFKIEHRAADTVVRQSYESLNALVKQVQQFTFGFIDHRVLINNILTPDRTLRNLESEFSKRGIGAIVIPAGITLGGFRQFLAIICDTPEHIEENGGIRRYYERNKIEGVRIVPGVKGVSSTEETVLEGDPESLLAAQRLAMESQPTLGLDLLMEAVGMSGNIDDETRAGVSAGLAGLGGGIPGGLPGHAGGGGAGGAGTGGTGGGLGGGVGSPGGLGVEGSVGAGGGGVGGGTGFGAVGASEMVGVSGVGSGGPGGGTGAGIGGLGVGDAGAGGPGGGGFANAGGAVGNGGPGTGSGVGTGTGGLGTGMGGAADAGGGGLVGGGGAGIGGPAGSGAGGQAIAGSSGPSGAGTGAPGSPMFAGGPGGSAFTGSGGASGGGSQAGGMSSNQVPFPSLKSIASTMSAGAAADLGSGGAGLGTGTAESIAIPGKPGEGGAPGVGRAAPGLGFARVASSAIASDPNQVFDIAQKALVRSFSNSAADPAQALTALAHMLEEFNPEVLLPALSAEKRAALKGKPAREIAADFMEDVAAEWAANRLSSVPGQEDSTIAEAEVIRVLQRSLEATVTVERLLHKLSRLFEKANLPPEFFTRIQQELRWMEVSDEDKFKQLMAIDRYSAAEFKRLSAYIKNAVRRGDLQEAADLVEHYFAVLELGPAELQVVELARAPELLQSIARLQTKELMQKLASRLSDTVFDEGFRGWFHTHAANCLATAAHCMAPYEDFDGIYLIAQSLEKSRLRSPQLHKDCCGEALGNLLGPRSIERLVELYSLRKYGQRMVVSILRLMGRLGAEKIFQRLEEERVASNRLALIRLIGQMGTVAHEVARSKLRDERWYVVRNACYVLTETHDPEIIQDMRVTLRHPDERVQESAFHVITKSKAAGKAAALADALPYLRPHVLEQVLNELRFLKSPEAIQGVEAFIALPDERIREKEQAVHALVAIPQEGGADALARILKDENNAPSIRRIAIKTLSKSNLSVAYQALAEVASRVPRDPMAREAQAALEIE